MAGKTEAESRYIIRHTCAHGVDHAVHLSYHHIM